MGISCIHRVLFENKRKLKNRHILNGTYGGVRGRLINQGLASYSINVQNECVASIVRYGISRDGGYSPTSKKHHG